MHTASLDEFRAHFVDEFPKSETRAALFSTFCDHRGLLLATGTVEFCWVDGSYVERKLNPGDIDLVVGIRASDAESLGVEQRILLQGLLSPSQAKHTYGCHAFPVPLFPEGHPGHKHTQNQLAYWRRQFGHTRAGNTKGIIVLTEQNWGGVR